MKQWRAQPAMLLPILSLSLSLSPPLSPPINIYMYVCMYKSVYVYKYQLPIFATKTEWFVLGDANWIMKYNSHSGH